MIDNELEKNIQDAMITTASVIAATTVTNTKSDNNNINH